MQTVQLKAMQYTIGVKPDGFWGPKSIQACQLYLKGLMPSPSPWPHPDQESLKRFFGKPGDENNLVNLAVGGFNMQYSSRVVKSLYCHKRVAPSLARILKEISASPFTYLLQNFDGCYNFRSVRGGNVPSLHAYGAAIDFDSSTNGNQQNWPISSTMPLEVMVIFAKEGWTPAGAFWGRDAMHFQTTQPS